MGRAVRLGLALGFLGLFVLVPLAAVFAGALGKGVGVAVAAIATRETQAALRLTLLATAIAVPVNLCFGLAAAWLLARFTFPGKGLLTTLIDLPFSISPVIAGLGLVLLFGGRAGLFGPWLASHGVKVIFSTPGIVLATVFVTFPFVAREVLAQLQAQGADAEEAALTLGASGWQTFTRVTLPRIRWSVLYGVILCTARATGEFGAVSVVSGHVRGVTNTLPLHVEVLYEEHQLAAAFAVASVLTLIALATLVAKHLVTWRSAT